MIHRTHYPERRLWLAVLEQGLRDALGPEMSDESAGNGSRRETAIARQNGKRWLQSPDFRDVCFRAGLDPDAVLRRINAGLVDLRKSGRYTYGASKTKPTREDRQQRPGTRTIEKAVPPVSSAGWHVINTTVSREPWA